MAETYTLKVNGIELSTDHQIPTAIDILKLAKEKDAIPGNPNKYILQGDKGKYGGDTPVDLKQDNVFITIPNEPTPVA